MERWKGKIAVVTGSSSGIGAGIAEALVNEGLLVVGIARQKDKIEALSTKLQDKPGKLYAFEADVTKEEDILAAFKWIKDNLGTVHILVNSAGVLLKATLLDGETETWKKMFDTNTLSLCITSREAIKEMRANDVDGHVIHINSIGGHRVPFFEFLNVYSGTKFAITALTETLRNELNAAKSKIKVSSISPGVVYTELMANGGCFDRSILADIYKTASLVPEDVANAVLYALSTPPHVQVHELIIRAIGER